MSPSKPQKLGKLHKGDKAKILSIDNVPLSTRLMAMGLLEGEKVEVVHEAPFGKNPLAIRVRGSLIALRRQEANHVEVELL
jgi:ferrous iron transport protein A